MKAISIRQPWAWLIFNAGKDIENRTWSTTVRGRVLVHAAKGMTKDEWSSALYAAHDVCGVPQSKILECPLHQVERGGIVGSVELVDCVSASSSPWFGGPWGFVLRDPRRLPFTPYKGALGWFDVPGY